MPHLLVDLEDVRDCERAIKMLRRRVAREGGPGGERHAPRGCGPRGRWARQAPEAAHGEAESLQDLPLRKKLARLQSRGMWKHLVKIAQSAPQPLSLPELDKLLDLPKNKMRSLKAIMAKLENRFDLQFLKVDPDAGLDEAGNPRYIMVPRVRREILLLAGQ